MRIEILHLKHEALEASPMMMLSPTRDEAVALLRASMYERVAVVDTMAYASQGWAEDEMPALRTPEDDNAFVAELYGGHLDVAWEASQNVAGPWVMSDVVEEQKYGTARSSMVGDLFVAGDMPFLVKGSGFECLVPGRDPV